MTTIALTALATVTGGATATQSAPVPALAPKPAAPTDRLELLCRSLDRAATKAADNYSRAGDAATINAISDACWIATRIDGYPSHARMKRWSYDDLSGRTMATVLDAVTPIAEAAVWSSAHRPAAASRRGPAMETR